MNLADFDQIVPDMVDAYKNTYNLILEKQGSYSNQVSSLFDALLTSTNKDFSTSMNDHLDKWEDSEIESFENLKSTANTKYYNLCKRYKRKRSSFKQHCSKSSHLVVLPTKKDAQIMAITSELETLKSQMSVSLDQQAFYGNHNSGGLSQNEPNSNNPNCGNSFGIPPMAL